MLSNYLRVALRTHLTQKGYAFINVAGLAVGLAFCLLIYLYVQHEWSYDRSHTKADRIYRVHRVTFEPDGSLEETDPYLPGPLGPAMQRDFPEVQQYVRFWESPHFVKADIDAFEETILFADPSVFEVFTFPLVRGNPATALTRPNSVVLSETAARRYFGQADPMGQRLSLRLGATFDDFVVTGVAQDVPDNSSVRFELLAPFNAYLNAVTFFGSRADRWGFSAFPTYVRLDENASGPLAPERLLQFRRTYYPNELDELSTSDARAEGVVPATYRMQALPDIHLNPAVSAGLRPPSDPRYTYILGAIALAVLFIACINFMTLAMGRSARRAKEVGVRKVVGALRTQLMGQFWIEALLLSGLALGVGLVLAALFLPAFNGLTGLHFTLDAVGLGVVVLGAGVTLLTGLLAGAYPALVLSNFRPIDVLNNRFRLGGANAFTTSLVVVQFGLSVFLITCTLVMLNQLEYLRTKNLGFDKEHLVVIPTKAEEGTRAVGIFRDALGGRSNVRGITATTASFARGGARLGFEFKGDAKEVYVFGVESNYVDLMGMELVAGRSFDPNLATDSAHAVVVNEALVRDFGWNDPIGQPMTGMTDSPDTDPVVVGVLEDYNFRSLETEVQPLMLRLGSPSYRYLLVRLTPHDIPATLDALRTTWQRVAGDTPFTYTFLDDDLDAQYRDYVRWSRIVGYAAAFAICIACLGLFGLAALSVAGRTKEIGIRKVLGASVARVTVLLSREFALFVLLACMLGTPAAFIAMRSWLDRFAFRIELSWYLFAAAGVAALVIALLTVSVQTVRAAMADPVKSLRYE